jgi:subtilisin-like proprotein convertase family protein
MKLPAALCAAVLLFAGTASAAVQTYSANPNVFIPVTTTGVDTFIHVPDSGTVNSITVNVTFHLPILADIQLFLTDPSGTVTNLTFNRRGGVGDGLINVTFTDAAGSEPPDFLTNGQCLSNTSYAPAQPLSAFAGVQIQGDWKLTIADNAGPDSVDCDCDPINEGPPCPRLFESWSITVDYSTNQTPVALCHDVTVAANASSCTANASIDNGSTDPDGDTLTLTQDPPGPYPLGTTEVTLTATDPDGASSSCTANVTVTDETGPSIDCDAPATITPPDAPVSFTATAGDSCGSATVEIVSYDCYAFTNKGKQIDKRGSCGVAISGATVTISDSGGVGDTIEWVVEATDAQGNTSQHTCKVKVVNPGH